MQYLSQCPTIPKRLLETLEPLKQSNADLSSAKDTLILIHDLVVAWLSPFFIATTSVGKPTMVSFTFHHNSTCANGRNNVASVWTGLNVWSLSNFVQQHATTFNNMQQGVQTDATCNIQQCWELLLNNVASVCTQPNPPLAYWRFFSVPCCLNIWSGSMFL